NSKLQLSPLQRKEKIQFVLKPKAIISANTSMSLWKVED
ncbi:MAG: hypothetical protein ACI8RD_002778, partial [Bacillariaceae sp.]